jgi:Leucine-rich repeat (LRR) protein
MGAILNAQDQTIRRGVAMKVMLQSGGSDDVLRFVEEAQITGQLEHPNIVPVYELGVDEQDQPFYTMKFVRGISLRKVLELLDQAVPETVRKYPLGVLLTIFQKVCDALAFAHAKGVIHRDLKPENIMLGEYGEALVMDWGLAKVLGAPSAKSTVVHSARQQDAANATLAGSILGTPQYMAPEQAAGLIDELDARTDIYALGAILYHMLTLHPPVRGETVELIVERVRTGKVDFGSLTHATRSARGHRLPHLPDGLVPESLCAVVRKAMALEPAARYASVKDLQADIEAYQNGFATKAEGASVTRQIALFVRRNKTVALATAAVLLVGAIFGTRAVVEGRRAKAALARLQATAPTFAAQAAALVEAQKFNEALDKIAFAIDLDGANADYHLARANTLQALARLREAAESYRHALALRDDPAAKTNLALCEQLLAQNGGNSELTIPLKNKLLDAILAQKRQADAVPLSHELKRDSDTALALIRTRLKSIMAQPGWKSDMLKRQPDGTYQLDLRWSKFSDLSFLDGLPISRLDLGGSGPLALDSLPRLPLDHLSLSERPITDLSPLKGLPLRSLAISGTKVADLTPLAGMRLEWLYINGSKVTDLTPLRGMRLKVLDAGLTGIRDLRPLGDSPMEWLTLSDCTKLTSLDGVQKMPLRTLNIFRAAVEELSPLRGNAVKQIWLDRCDRLRDLTPLLDCKQLEAVTLPTHLSDIAFLKAHPTLKQLSNQPIETFNWTPSRIPSVADFFAKSGERLARQVPMEKQLEKFRQSLIAQGNDPDKVPRFAFNTEGKLVVRLMSPAIWKCSDISELRGVAVTEFYCDRPITSIAALAGAPLEHFQSNSASLTDLSPLRGATLVEALLGGTSVADLSPLRGMPLRKLTINKTAVSDVAILAEFLTLEEVILPTGAKNIEALRRLPKIARISYQGTGPGAATPAQTAAEFWKEFDAKKAGVR